MTHDTSGSRAEQGGVVIEWLLAFPMFMVVFFLIIQVALVGVASLVVQYAAFSAGRAAVVGLPEHTRENAETAGVFVLAALSPAVGTPERGAAALGRTFDRQGEPWSFPRMNRRAGFAREAASIRINPDEILAGPETLTVEIEYPLRLAIPIASAILAPSRRVVAGVPGHFVVLRARVQMRSTGSRVAAPLSALGRLDP